MPIVFGGTPATPHETSRASGRSPSSAAFSGVVTTQTAAPSFCPLALPAVTVASGSSLPMIGRSLASVSTVGVGPDVLVAVDDGLALPARHGDRDDLVGEPARLRGRGGALVAADGVLVLLLAGDPVLPAQVLRGLDHAAGHRVVLAAGGDPAAGQRVLQQHAGAGA